MATTIESIRDKLLLSTDCLSKYRKRADKCRYCEIDFTPGRSCPHREWLYKYNFEEKTGLDTFYSYRALNILTYAALANWQAYADYIGEDALRAEILEDLNQHIPAGKMGTVFAVYPFLKG